MHPPRLYARILFKGNFLSCTWNARTAGGHSINSGGCRTHLPLSLDYFYASSHLIPPMSLILYVSISFLPIAPFSILTFPHCLHSIIHFSSLSSFSTTPANRWEKRMNNNVLNTVVEMYYNPLLSQITSVCTDSRDGQTHRDTHSFKFIHTSFHTNIRI